MENRKNEAKPRFVVGKPKPGWFDRRLILEQVVFLQTRWIFLESGWLLRMSSGGGTLDSGTNEHISYEILKQDWWEAREGLDDYEREDILPELFSDLASTWCDTEHHEVVESREMAMGRKDTPYYKMVMVLYHFQAMVMPMPNEIPSVLEIEGPVPEGTSASELQAFVSQLFEDVKCVTGDRQYTLPEISRLFAENRNFNA